MVPEPQPEGAARTDRLFLYYLCLIGFFAIFSTTISKNPVLPLLVQAMGGGDPVLGIIAAVSPLAGILFSFPVGVLSDRFGRRRLLAVSGCIFLLAPLLYLLVSDPVWLIPVRFFHGMATAILGPVVSAAIAERFPAARAEMLGTYASATLVGRTIAPLAGGIIISVFVFAPGLVPYRMVYAAAFIAAIPVFILILRYREEARGAPDIPGFSVFAESLSAFVANRRLRGAAMADMAAYFSYGVLETFLPVYLAGLQFPAYQIGVIFAIQVLIIAATKPLFGRIADRIDRRIQIAAGLLITGGAVAMVPAVASYPGFLVASAVFGTGISLSTVATSAYVADIAKKEQIGSSMGALSSIMDIGQSAGPLVCGVIITLAGYPAGFLTGCVLIAGVTAVFILSVRDKRGDPSGSSGR